VQVCTAFVPLSPQTAARRFGIGLGLGGIAIMAWLRVGGGMFVLEPVDKIARRSCTLRLL
jgi:hypothetical protein